MKIPSGRVLDRLPAEEPCLGALFTSYSFDPAFFEDHVLRAVLRLASDPVEQAERYHQEACRALQETPVVAIVDAGERRPGRRLPFDLLEIADTVFHAKSALLIYRDFARLLVGSGNLTAPGYGGNTELFLCLDLPYEQRAAAALLKAFDEHLERVGRLVRRQGTQLALFREELQRRLPAGGTAQGRGEFALLDSLTGPIVGQLEDLLPPDARIESVGFLAPFYEHDDVSDADAPSVFRFLVPRLDPAAVLDVGVAWDNPQVQVVGDSDLESGLGDLWTWVGEKDGSRVLEHLIPTSLGPNTVSYTDAAGAGRRCPLEEAQEAVARRVLWRQPPPIAFAPQNAVAGAKGTFSDVRLWLHPATRLVEGRPVHRPLHAKLIVLGYRSGGARQTMVLVGSPNMSRRALLMPAGPAQGNVELAVAFCMNGDLSLRDLVPELVFAPASRVELQEREFHEPGRNYALAIAEASHDPAAQTLTVSWSQDARHLRDWRLSYCGRTLAAGDVPPDTAVVAQAFRLEPASAELVIHVAGQEYPVPILVTDLVALPATPAAPFVGLDELLMLLGRRVGAERALQIATQRAAAGENSDELAAYFGDGFSPTDVFRAWWSVAEDLMDDSLSVQAFRLRLDGALGVGAAWRCMKDSVADATMTADEAWFYGAELLRTLRDVELPVGVDRGVKIQVLGRFCDGVRCDLDLLGLSEENRPWVRHVCTFYREAQ